MSAFPSALSLTQTSQFLIRLLPIGLLFQLFHLSPALSLPVLAFGLEQQEAALSRPELAPLLLQRFDFGAAHLPIFDLLTQLLVARHSIAGELIDSKMLIQIGKVVGRFKVKRLPSHRVD